MVTARIPEKERRSVPVCYRCGEEFPDHSRVPSSHIASCRLLNPLYVYVCPIRNCQRAPFSTWRRAAIHIRRDHAKNWQAREPSIGVARIIRVRKADYDRRGKTGS